MEKVSKGELGGGSGAELRRRRMGSAERLETAGLKESAWRDERMVSTLGFRQRFVEGRRSERGGGGGGEERSDKEGKERLVLNGPNFVRKKERKSYGP